MPPAFHQVSATPLKLLTQQIHPHVRVERDSGGIPRIMARASVFVREVCALKCFISPTHKRTEGRAPVWGSEFTSKNATLQGGDPAETAVG